MNRIHQILYQMGEARKTVLAMTGLTEEALNEMQWNAAYECLERILGKDEYGKNDLPKHGKFWDWWKDQWYRRDRIFLDKLQYDTDLMKYVVIVPQNREKIVLHTQEHILYAYQLYHKIEPDNKLINSVVVEMTFRDMAREFKK